MALHINKDRSNLDSHDKTIAVETFVNSVLDGLDIKSSKSDDIFYEWSADFDYKKFMQDMDNKRNMSKYSKWKQYESKD